MTHLQRLSHVLLVLMREDTGGNDFTLREVAILLTATPYANRDQPDKAISVIDVAEKWDFNKPSVSRNLTMLVRHGYLSRVQNSDDRRRVVIRRTEKGEQLLLRVEIAMAS